jgi:hypothetical protein
VACGELFLGHPEDIGGELVRNFGTRIGRREDVAARGVDLVGDNQRNGFARRCLRQVAISRDDGFDLRRLARLGDDDLVAWLDEPET